MASLKFDISQKPRNEEEFVKWMEAKFEVPNEQAKSLDVHHIQLTSNPERLAANKLYQDLGFDCYETNCYKMIL